MVDAGPGVEEFMVQSLIGPGGGSSGCRGWKFECLPLVDGLRRQGIVIQGYRCKRRLTFNIMSFTQIRAPEISFAWGYKVLGPNASNLTHVAWINASPVYVILFIKTWITTTQVLIRLRGNYVKTGKRWVRFQQRFRNFDSTAIMVVHGNAICLRSNSQRRVMPHSVVGRRWSPPNMTSGLRLNESEIAKLLEQATWVQVDPLPGRKAIGSRFVYANKHDEHGQLVRRKARLVSAGFPPHVDGFGLCWRRPISSSVWHAQTIAAGAGSGRVSQMAAVQVERRQCICSSSNARRPRNLRPTPVRVAQNADRQSVPPTKNVVWIWNKLARSGMTIDGEILLSLGFVNQAKRDPCLYIKGAGELNGNHMYLRRWFYCRRKDAAPSRCDSGRSLPRNEDACQGLKVLGQVSILERLGSGYLEIPSWEWACCARWTAASNTHVVASTYASQILARFGLFDCNGAPIRRYASRRWERCVGRWFRAACWSRRV